MPLKLIGAGLGRTGTVSLKLALEQLGLGPCYHMTELFMHPDHTPGWVRAADGHPNWEGIFRGYAATVDYPGCTFWRELAQRYPAAKVLLSVRDPDQWFESTQATIFDDESTATLSASPLREFFEKTVWRHFGDRVHDRAFMVELFQRHNAEVERTIPRERLLVYNITQGWEPCAAFLMCRFRIHRFPARIPASTMPSAVLRGRATPMHPLLSNGQMRFARHSPGNVHRTESLGVHAPPACALASDPGSRYRAQGHSYSGKSRTDRAAR